jgi:hypothetical protein
MEMSNVSVATLQNILGMAAIFFLLMGGIAAYWLLRYGCILNALAKAIGEKEAISIANRTALLGWVKE